MGIVLLPIFLLFPVTVAGDLLIAGVALADSTAADSKWSGFEEEDDGFETLSGEASDGNRKIGKR
ncbi:MAG: hypothetical protein H0X71_06920 [Rubrobacter sp.]|nr:hypothetical protein [Rubrobacter sp.]